MFWMAQSTVEETFNAYTDASLSPRRGNSPSQTGNEKRSARFQSESKVPTLSTVNARPSKSSSDAESASKATNKKTGARN